MTTGTAKGTSSINLRHYNHFATIPIFLIRQMCGIPSGMNRYESA